MPYVTTADHTQLYYKDWGRGRPVVLLHGWPLSADSWDDQALEMANAGYRVIAYDRRGFGRSSQPWNGYDYDTLTDDLRAVLKECQVSEGTLIGFSMGGGEVARYMTKYNGAGLAQAGLIASIVPYKLKTPDNPHGSEEKLLDETLAGIKEDRPKFFAEFFKKFYGVDRRRETREQGTAAVVIECDDAGRAQRHPRLHGVDLQDGFPAGSRVIQSADAHHSWDGGPERVDRCVRAARGAGHQEFEAHRVRRLAAWTSGD